MKRGGGVLTAGEGRKGDWEGVFWEGLSYVPRQRGGLNWDARAEKGQAVEEFRIRWEGKNWGTFSGIRRDAVGLIRHG